MLNHAPDLRKNESLLQDPRKWTSSASDKASRYFTDLLHLRKKFWERYRHLLIPMIRTQIEKSGTKRLTTTATSHKLRQTKRSEAATRSNSPFGIRSPNSINSNIPETLRRSWGLWGFGIRPKDSIRLKKTITLEGLQRYGRSPKDTNSKAMAETFKNRKLPKNNKVGNISVLQYLAHSLFRK